jgi:rifampicin phosphotransferase
MTRARVVGFEDQDSCCDELVGGKGANLGRLSSAGFKVPAGFTMTTAAYGEFVGDSGLDRQVGAILSEIDYDDPAQLEACSTRIRAAITTATIAPALAQEIRHAYAALGDQVYVAVRSSGTAEDLAAASFAGLHDTYLDVRGNDEVMDAVKRCWASLWSGRAIAYRRNLNFDHASVRMAVVIQTMVASEVAGVMFTGNPLTAATDEIVINASWGLGESVVSGIVVPDQYVLKVSDLRIKDRIAGNKTLEIVRDPATCSGTVEREVAFDRRSPLCLSDTALNALGVLGKSVLEYYEGIPQDIEWAMVGGVAYLLQSRPVTGVEFSWDTDVDSWQSEADDDDNLWSRTMADDLWTGAVTPLFFCHRGSFWSAEYRHRAVQMFDKPALGKIRFLKYHKGEAYMNALGDLYFTEVAPPAVRAGLLAKLPPSMQKQATGAPFSWFAYLKVYLRSILMSPRARGPYGWLRTFEDYRANHVEAAEGMPDAQLPALSDDELKRYITRQQGFEYLFAAHLAMPGMVLYFRDAMTALYHIVDRWYDGDNVHAFSDLITGTQRLTATVREHIALYDMSRLIRNSGTLREKFESSVGASFFDAIRGLDTGRELSAKVTVFLSESGHRGQADRDFYYPRYLDDPDILYRALATFIKSDDDPRIREQGNNRKRDAAIADIERQLRQQSWGLLKVRLFRWVLVYVLRCLECRDDERHFIDRNTYSLRKAFLEANRRIRERGRLQTDRDFWFLSITELYEVLDGDHNPTLTHAKVGGRMRNFERFERRDFIPPKFFRRDRELRFAESATATTIDGSLLRGIPTSRGRVTAVARVVKRLSDIGRINAGEILVANSTDPGWTPVFAVISGVVVETGGLLSHSSCLAREYGFPAAQVEDAMRLIADGATITLDGDTGEVWLVGGVPATAT